MIKIITGQDDAVSKWASEKLGFSISPPLIAIGFTDNDMMTGAAVFNDFNGSNIELTVYAPGCFTRPILKYVFEYAFRQLGVLRITARTPRANKKMRELLPRLGFLFEGTSKQYYGPKRGDDAFLYALFQNNAMKWMQ